LLLRESDHPVADEVGVLQRDRAEVVHVRFERRRHRCGFLAAILARVVATLRKQGIEVRGAAVRNEVLVNEAGDDVQVVNVEVRRVEDVPIHA